MDQKNPKPNKNKTKVQIPSLPKFESQKFKISKSKCKVIEQKLQLLHRDYFIKISSIHRQKKMFVLLISSKRMYCAH